MLSDDVFVHPQALVESDQVGAGTRVWAFAHIMPGAVVGRSCNVGEQCFIEQGVRVGDGVTIKNGISLWDGVVVEDDVFLGPHCVLTNVLRPRAFIKTAPEDFQKTVIKQGATIGAGAVLICGHQIGRYAFVAAGAVVTSEVLDHQLVAGHPAQAKGWVCRCGQKLSQQLQCADCGLYWQKTDRGLEEKG